MVISLSFTIVFMFQSFLLQCSLMCEKTLNLPHTLHFWAALKGVLAYNITCQLTFFLSSLIFLGLRRSWYSMSLVISASSLILIIFVLYSSSGLPINCHMTLSRVPFLHLNVLLNAFFMSIMIPSLMNLIVTSMILKVTSYYYSRVSTNL